jgi:hypothetical protein
MPQPAIDSSERNCIGDAELEALVEGALGRPQCLRTLQSLRLTANRFTNAGATLLRERALQRPECLQSLQRLDLGENDDVGYAVRERLQSDLPRPTPRLPGLHTYRLSAAQRAAFLWRVPTKKHSKTMPWAARRRAAGLGEAAADQAQRLRALDALLVRADWGAAEALAGPLRAARAGPGAASPLLGHARLGLAEAAAVAAADGVEGVAERDAVMGNSQGAVNDARLSCPLSVQHTSNHPFLLRGNRLRGRLRYGSSCGVLSWNVRTHGSRMVHSSLGLGSPRCGSSQNVRTPDKQSAVHSPALTAASWP